MAQPATSRPEHRAFDVFLCYNRQDREHAEQILNDLFRLYNIVGWMDRRELSAGANFEAEIAAALNSSSSCALVIGEHGIGPYQGAVELPMAQKRQRTDPAFRVLPVILHSSAKEQVAKLGFPESTQFADLSEPANRLDGIWSLASAMRPGLPHPEKKLLNSMRNVESNYRRWQDSERQDKSFLLSGTALRDARDLQRENPKWLRPEHAAFLAECESAERERARRTTRIAVGVALAGLALSAVAGASYFRARASEKLAKEESAKRLVAQKDAEDKKKIAEEAQKAETVARESAEEQRDRAMKAEQDARSRALAVEASGLATRDWRTSLLLAAESVQRSPTAESIRVALGGAAGLLTVTPISADEELSPHAKYRAWNVSRSDDARVIQIRKENSRSPVATARHAAGIDDVDYDDEETIVAAVGKDGWIGVYDLASGKRRFEMPATGSAVDVRVSRRGRWLAAGRVGNRLDIVETRGGTVVKTLSLPFRESWERPWAVAFDDLENYCAMGTTQGHLKIADLRKMDSWRVDRHGTIGSVVFDPSGRHVAFAEWYNQKPGAQNAVHLTDLNTRQTAEIWRPDANPVELEFSRDGAWLAMRDGSGSVATVRMSDRSVRRHPEGEPASAIAFRPDSSALVTGGKEGLRVISLQNGDVRVARRSNSIRRLFFAGSGSLLVTLVDDVGLTVLDAWNFAELGVFRSATGVFKLNESRVEASTQDDGSFVVDVGKRNRILSFDSADPVVEAALTADSRLVAIATEGGGLRLAGTEDLKTKWERRSYWPGDLVFDAAGERLAVTNARLPQARIFRVKTGEDNDLEVPEAYYSLNDFRFSPDGRYALMAALLGPIRLVDLTGRQKPWQQEVGQPLYRGVFSADGSHFATVASERVSVRRTAAPDKVLLSRDSRFFRDACFSYDSRTLVAVESIGGLHIYGIPGGKESGVLPISDGSGPPRIACSPTAAVAAIATNSVIQIVSIITRQVLFEEPGKIDPRLIGFAPSGKRLAVAGGNQRVRVIDLETHQAVHADLPGDPREMAWTDGSKRLRVLTVDAGDRKRVTLIEFPVTAEDVVAEACGKAGSNLSKADWDRFLAGTDYRRTCKSLPEPE